jgi:hypothetical protein
MSKRTSQPGHATLTEPQRRHLMVILDRIEAALAEIVSLATAPRSDGTLVLDLPDLPADLLARVRPELNRVHRSILTLATRFDLDRQPRSRRRRSHALIGTAIVQAEDAKGAALRAYGPVEPSVVRELDPIMHEIGQALAAIAAAIGSDADSPGVAPEGEAP